MQKRTERNIKDIRLRQCFSNWGPRHNFLRTAKHLPKKSTWCTWRKKCCVK